MLQALPAPQRAAAAQSMGISPEQLQAFAQMLSTMSPEQLQQLGGGMGMGGAGAIYSSGAGVMEKTPLVHLTPNIIMNVNMLEAAYKENIKKFIFISSNTVYPFVDFAVKENDANFDFYEKYYATFSQ